MFIDANSVSEDKLKCDICIIGSGPAGSSLAIELSNAGKDVILVESGGIGAEVKANQLNQTRYESNFTYRKNFTNRYRQVGGTANVWAGRIVPYKFDPVLDAEWGDLPVDANNFASRANKFLGVTDSMLKSYDETEKTLVAFWGKNIERFNSKSKNFNGTNIRIVYHLTFIGDASLDGGTIKSMLFENSNQSKKISIEADSFVLASGGIENSRSLLLLKDKLEPLMGDNFQNVGRFFMDHPKVTHGDLLFKKLDKQIDHFQLKVVKDGRVKYGIRNIPRTGIRIYSNLVDVKSDLVSKLYPRIANIYKSLTKKVYYDKSSEKNKTDVIDDLIYLLEPEELIPHGLLYYFGRISPKMSKNNKKIKVITYIEQLPDYNNHIGLDTETKDKFGNPTPVVHLNISEEEKEAIVHYYNDLKTDFKEIGGELAFSEDYLRDTKNFTEASHHIGGTRYSVDQSKSVTDKELRVLGTKNLYVTGSSVFPTCSVENPTYLIVCISCYLASVIKSVNK